MEEWNHKDEWRRRGKDFLVTITRHTEASFDPYDGPNRWAVYAYVYPKHPYFDAFDGTETTWQDAASRMPLHGGPSFMRVHKDFDGKVTAQQVGADYHHLHDDAFAHHATKEDAYEVFNDAGELFQWLETMADL